MASNTNFPLKISLHDMAVMSSTPRRKAHSEASREVAAMINKASAIKMNDLRNQRIGRTIKSGDIPRFSQG